MNSISLDLPKTDFKGGETVQGELVLKIRQSFPVRGIRVKFEGVEHARWSSGGGKSRRVYSEEKILFAKELTLYGKPKLKPGELLKDSVSGILSKKKYEWIQPGNYRYPFSYTLPVDLPGDYDSPGDSEIRYQIKGYVDVPLKWDLEAAQNLTVYEVYRPEDVDPVASRKSKSFLFDSRGNLSIKASVERNVFFVGEIVTPLLEIDNRSGKPVKAVTLKLMQIETLRAGNHDTRHEHEAAVQVYRECRVAPGGTASFQPDFAIPGDLYPSVRSGALVRVEYELAFRLDVPWALDLQVSLPIVLLERAGVPAG